MYKIITSPFETVTSDLLNGWINEYLTCVLPEIEKVGHYYQGKNEIIKMGCPLNRPNYNINVNIAKYISDVATSYFIGNAVTYSATTPKGQDIIDKIKPILKLNNEEETNFSVASDMSSHKIGYELMYFADGKTLDNRIKFKNIAPTSAFIVYDDTIESKPVAGVYFRAYKIKNTLYRQIYVYTRDFNYEFDGKSGQPQLINQEDNLFKDICLRACKNNSYTIGDYEPVTDLLDALSLVISNTTDDLQSIANAILAVYGARFENQEDIDAVNKNKLANLPSGSKMEWVIKNINTDVIKTQADYLTSFIFQICQVPDLTDDAFAGNLSGVALQYKLWGLEQLRASKEMQFKKFLKRRIQLIINALNLTSEDDLMLINDIEIQFHKNLPENMNAEYEMVKNLRGLISDETLLEKLSIIKDVQEEIKRMDEQREKEANEYGFGNGEINAEVETEQE